MEKPEGAAGGDEATRAAKKAVDEAPDTDAEKKLKEETEKAKKELIDQIKNFKTEDDDSAIVEEE